MIHWKLDFDDKLHEENQIYHEALSKYTIFFENNTSTHNQ